MDIKEITQELRSKNLGEFAEEIERVISVRETENGHKCLSETVDIKKIAIEEDFNKKYGIAETYILKLLKQHVPKARIDLATLIGVMPILGLGDVEFSIREGKFYIKIKEIMVKNDQEKLITSLLALGTTVFRSN